MKDVKSYDDFLNAFSSEQDIQTDKDYYDMEDKYYALFRHRVPREMLPDCISMDEIKEAMSKCINEKQDRLFDILGVEISNEHLY